MSHLTIDEVKKLVKDTMRKSKSVAAIAGTTFVNSKGSVGTILADLSDHGKVQASMTCVLGGPDHIREQSDWHQCSVSPQKAKRKSSKSVVTADGTKLKLEIVNPDDPPEVQESKEANNAAYAAAKAAIASSRAAAKAAAKVGSASEHVDSLSKQIADVEVAARQAMEMVAKYANTANTPEE